MRLDWIGLFCIGAQESLNDSIVTVGLNLNAI